MGIDLSVADNVLVSCSLDMTAIVWDLSTGQPRHRLSGHTDQLRDVVLFKERRNFFDDPDDPKAAGAPSAQPGATARVQSAAVAAGAKGKAGPARSASGVVRVTPAPSGGATAGGAGTGATAAATAGVKRARHLQVFTCGLDHTIVQWDGETGERVRRLVGHSAPVRGLVIVNSTLFSCSSDFTVRQWDTSSGKVRTVPRSAMLPRDALHRGRPSRAPALLLVLSAAFAARRAWRLPPGSSRAKRRQSRLTRSLAGAPPTLPAHAHVRRCRLCPSSGAAQILGAHRGGLWALLRARQPVHLLQG